MGLRAEESSARSKLNTLTKNARNSCGGRTWFDWLPIHTLSTSAVFAEIAQATQQPHWAYQAGMTRLSCVFCIMASAADLRTAARLRPRAGGGIVSLELGLDYTMSMSKKTLPEITGIQPQEGATAHEMP